MKEPVGQCVRLQPGDRVGRVVAGVGEHVVPLQDLMKDNSVHEAAESHAQQQTWSLRMFWSRW